MKAPSFIAALFVSALCLAAQAQQEAAPTPTPASILHMDILLEGPWILYEDHKILKDMSVLVAIAPLPDSDGHAFHYPLVSTGDGHGIAKSGIYCIYFDQKCGRDGDVPLTYDSYSAVAVLKVNATKKWTWTDLRSRAIILLFPMPDSYSNEEAWSMRFKEKFDGQPSGYQPYGGWNHSIGVQLHYATGPRRMRETECQLISTPTVTVNCSKPDETHMLYNTGTLRVVMKAPDLGWFERGYDYCDFHVRHTYPQMLSLVDGQNNEIKVIDPAVQISEDGKAVFDDGNLGCLDGDDQGDYYSQEEYRAHAKLHSKTLAERINELNDGLKSLSKYQHQGDLDQHQNDKQYISSYGKVFGGINDITKKIDDEKIGLSNSLPRISQLTIIRSLLLQASDQVNALNNILSVEWREQTRKHAGHSDAHQASGQAVEKQLSIDLNKLQNKILAFVLDGAPSKDGKDCRAPIMQVQVQP